MISSSMEIIIINSRADALERQKDPFRIGHKKN
jgi:hypothetical protein